MDAYGEMLSLSFSKKDMLSMRSWNLSILFHFFRYMPLFRANYSLAYRSELRQYQKTIHKSSITAKPHSLAGILCVIFKVALDEITIKKARESLPVIW